MANSSFTKGTLATPVGPENGGTGLSTLGTAGQTQVVNEAGTAMEWGQAGNEGISSYTASTYSKLDCGNSPSATTVFDTLVNTGGNDGALDITIDATSFNDVPIDFKNLGTEAAVITQSTNNMNIDSTGLFGQSFTAPSGCYVITNIGIGWQGGGTALTISLIVRSGSTIGSGTILYQATKSVGGGGGIQSWSIDQIDCEPGDTFNFTAIKNGGGTNYARYQNTNVYAGGNLYRTGAEQTGEDLQFSVNGLSHQALSTSLIASKLQSGIRSFTGKQVACSYETDHYVIATGTPGPDGSISVLSSPSSGTDISGAGATPYLDGETGRGTVTSGTGDGGKVSLLNDSGKIDSDFIDGTDSVNTATAGALVGGSSPSATTVFDTLASGSNNGAIKVSIDGTEYDNVAISARAYGTAAETASKTGYYSDTSTTMGGEDNHGQTFVAPAGMYTLSSFRIHSYTPSSGSGFNFKLKAATQPNLGTNVSPTYTASWTNDSNWQEFTFTEPVPIEPGTTYTIVIWWNSGSPRLGYTNGTNSTFPSSYWLSNSGYGGPLEIMLFGSNLTASTGSVLASNLQAGIRTATSGSETATYANGKYTITSGTTGNSSEVSAFSTPTSGADLSGAGATSYFDCASNAIEVAGTGDDGKVVVLNADGAIDGAFIGGGIVGDRVAKTINTTYLATTDGFVDAMTQWNTNNPSGVTIYSDANSNPSTVVARQEVYSSSGNEYVTANALIKKGNYWKTSFYSNGSKTVYWTPIGR